MPETDRRLEGIRRVSMVNLYIPLLLIFAVFGAFCFNMGHRRAYRLVLKGLLRGQIDFLSQRIASMNGRDGGLTREERAKALYSYETIGQLLIGWYGYFQAIGDDKELKALKGRIKRSLEEYLSAIEAADIDQPSQDSP
jgi:hypothetical protein